MPDELAQIIGNCTQFYWLGFAEIKDGVFVFANPSLCEMFSIASHEPIAECVLAEHISSHFHLITPRNEFTLIY